MSTENTVRGVESVESAHQEFLKVLRSKKYVEAIYSQVEQREGGRVLRKLVTIADLKSCEKGVIYTDRYLFTSVDSFKQTFKEALHKLPKEVREKCCSEGFFAETYASVMWFLDRGAAGGRWWDVVRDSEDFADIVLVPVGYDFIIDVDLGENPWLSEDDGLKRLNMFCDFMAEKLGLEPQVLISKGVQLKVSLHSLHLLHYDLFGEKWPLIVVKKLPEVHKKIAVKLSREFYEKYGIVIKVDNQVYDSARITRLSFSIHSGIKGFSIPFKPHMLGSLTWNKIRELQKSPGYVMSVIKKIKSVGTWGRVVKPEAYQRVLGFFLALEEGNLRLSIVTPVPKKGRSTPTGWRKVVDPVLGEVEYDARLEGFGWVEVLVKERIPIPDGRLAFCWSVLPVAIKGPKTKYGQLPPLTSREEAIEWLRKSLEKYPDPEKTLEDYIEKLDYNLKYGDKYNIPTWRHLVKERAENGERLAEAFLHIKYSIIYALYLHNYVRLNQEQIRKLKVLLNQLYINSIHQETVR